MAPDELVVLRADRMVDVEAGEVRAGRVVLVRGEWIEALLGPGQPVPEGAALVELPGHTLLPGLIDCHTHLVGELQGSGIPAIDRSAAQEALSGVGNARATVLAGFTTVRDVGTFRAFVDVIATGAVLAPGTRPGAPELSPDELAAAVEEAAGVLADRGVWLVADIYNGDYIASEGAADDPRARLSAGAPYFPA